MHLDTNVHKCTGTRDLPVQSGNTAVHEHNNHKSHDNGKYAYPGLLILLFSFFTCFLLTLTIEWNYTKNKYGIGDRVLQVIKMGKKKK